MKTVYDYTNSTNTNCPSNFATNFGDSAASRNAIHVATATSGPDHDHASASRGKPSTILTKSTMVSAASTINGVNYKSNYNNRSVLESTKNSNQNSGGANILLSGPNVSKNMHHHSNSNSNSDSNDVGDDLNLIINTRKSRNTHKSQQQMVRSRRAGVVNHRRRKKRKSRTLANNRGKNRARGIRKHKNNENKDSSKQIVGNNSSSNNSDGDHNNNNINTSNYSVNNKHNNKNNNKNNNSKAKIKMSNQDVGMRLKRMQQRQRHQHQTKRKRKAKRDNVTPVIEFGDVSLLYNGNWKNKNNINNNNTNNDANNNCSIKKNNSIHIKSPRNYRTSKHYENTTKITSKPKSKTLKLARKYRAKLKTQAKIVGKYGLAPLADNCENHDSGEVYDDKQKARDSVSVGELTDETRRSQSQSPAIANFTSAAARALNVDKNTLEISTFVGPRARRQANVNIDNTSNCNENQNVVDVYQAKKNIFQQFN